ncbi:MAG: amidohydrolase [Planctomycetes bacterium]|jgi:predicted TIM-barrel fold metal-dependent hydrolase|nr:amidohydrolase [Planctomycetota bacterium]
MDIIDAHAHLWLGLAAENRSALREEVDEAPLKRLYVSGLCSHLDNASTVALMNDEVAILMNECQQARGLVYLNPRHGVEAMDELKRRLDAGFSGVKLWTATTADDPLNYPIYEAAIERDVPVLLHAMNKSVGALEYESRSHHVSAAAARYPECTFIMAHVAAKFVAGVDAVMPYANVYVDICGSFGERGMVDYAVSRLGAHRVLFGTDMPSSNFYHNLGKVFAAELSDDQQRLILCGNAERIFK